MADETVTDTTTDPAPVDAAPADATPPADPAPPADAAPAAPPLETPVTVVDGDPPAPYFQIWRGVYGITDAITETFATLDEAKERADFLFDDGRKSIGPNLNFVHVVDMGNEVVYSRA